jgi:hypothetical protein
LPRIDGWFIMNSYVWLSSFGFLQHIEFINLDKYDLLFTAKGNILFFT